MVQSASYHPPPHSLNKSDTLSSPPGLVNLPWWCELCADAVPTQSAMLSTLFLLFKYRIEIPWHCDKESMPSIYQTLFSFEGSSTLSVMICPVGLFLASFISSFRKIAWNSGFCSKACRPTFFLSTKSDSIVLRWWILVNLFSEFSSAYSCRSLKMPLTM